MQGKVKWYNPNRGFGFIKKHDGSGDLFVHCTGIVSNPGAAGSRYLEEGQLVEFEETTGKDGRSRAVNVVVIP